MKTQYLIYGIIIAVIFIIVWIGMDTFTQPGISDLKGTYSEAAFYRNENNTGPVTRIYTVYAADTLWEDMEAYGNFMPHTKYGNTKVFFFSDLEQTPKEIVPEVPHFDAEYESYCIGKYEKSAMGEVSVIKFPFR
ncbi:MAG: hypothetical protein WD426_18420 [Anditalea sp.]